MSELKPCPFCGISLTKDEGRAVMGFGRTYIEVTHEENGCFLAYDIDFPYLFCGYEAADFEEFALKWNSRADASFAAGLKRGAELVDLQADLLAMAVPDSKTPSVIRAVANDLRKHAQLEAEKKL